MTTQYTETEIKLYVPELADVEIALQNAGAVLSAARVFERNVRYDTPDERLRAQAGVLRLRQDTRTRLTFKDGEKSVGEFGMTRFEAETEVGDFDAMEMILGKLGFVPMMVYEKYRTTYAFHETDVTLDEMPYGNFVEIEGLESDIRTVMQSLDLIDAKRLSNSYVVLFENVRRAMGLDITHLTFENFAGVLVPFSAFEGTQ